MPTLDEWQLAWHRLVLQSGARFKVIVAHRKARKTLLNIKELDRWAQAIPAVYWIVFPTMAQGKKIVWDDPDMFARNMLPYAWAHRNITDHYLQYPNGSKVYLIGAKGEDALRGPNPLGVIFDEYDDMGPNVWPTVQPVMTANPDAWAWFTGTYKGMKDLHAKMEYAKTHENWFGIVLPASKSGIISQEALDEAKATTPQAFYDMEYECIPVEGGMSFFTHIKDHMWPGEFMTTQGRTYKLGIDIAKLHDWTVITPVETSERPIKWGENPLWYVGIPERFNQMDYPLQQARIEASWARYNKAEVTLDATGVGNVLTDYLKGRIKPFDAVTFTEQMRMDLLKNLALMFAKGELCIPEYEQLIHELQSMSYDLTKTGRITIAVPDGQHDDCVMSLALAVWKIKRVKPEPTYQTQNFHDNTDDLWRGT